jgi:hydroxypyruvate reductase
MTPIELRALLVAAFRRALAGFDLAGRTAGFVREALPAGDVRVIAVGKAACAMTCGALQPLGARARSVLVVTTDASPTHALPPGTRVVRAAHPIPDRRSLSAARLALRRARDSAGGSLLVLVSGGTSALLCAPAPGLSLRAKNALVASLMRAGAPIGELNVVRRHLSVVKGGNLAAACPGRVVCGVASDVVGGAAHDVGSGPACPDPSTRADAASVLDRHLGPRARARFEPLMLDTLSPRSPEARRTHARIVASPEDLARELAGVLSGCGLRARSRVVGAADAEPFALELVHEARALAPGSAIVTNCEPTIALGRRHGRGGRAGWVALRALACDELPGDVAVLCGASDGVDGTSGTGGACVTRSSMRDLAPETVRRALEGRDDAAVHEQLGTGLPGGPTGLNLTDVYVVARAPGERGASAAFTRRRASAG